MSPQKECKCEKDLPSDAIVPSSSPELNLAELAQGYLRQLVVNDHLSGAVPWRGRVAHKMQIVRDKVVWMNEQKDYWKKLFGALKPRAQRCIDARGGLLKS